MLFYGYKVHIGVDGGSARVVTSVVTTTGTVRENQVAGELLDRHRILTGIKPAEVVGDKSYGTSDLFRLLRQSGIQATIPRARPWRKKRRKRLKAGYHYDSSRDVFIRPKGKTMCRVATDSSRAAYLVGRYSCRGCEHRGSLYGAYRPAITWPIDEDLYEWHNAHMSAAAARLSMKQRRIWPETVFAEMKNARGLTRARLRGKAKVAIEALMVMAAHNVRQLAKHIAGATAAALEPARSQPQTLPLVC